MKAEEHNGEKFGFLTLDATAYKKRNPKTHAKLFRFVCDCGNEIYTRFWDVYTGKTVSCGKCNLRKNTKSSTILGQKFGKLSPVKPVGEDSHKRVIWLFKCDCGNDYIGPLHNVKSGNTKSCGCSKHKTAPNSLDLIGHKFGRLTVVSKDKIEKGVVYWKCKCSCGNITIVPTGHLRSNRTKSCGCLVDDIQSKESYGYKWAHDVKALHEICIKCGSSEHLHAHHIFPRNQFPEMKQNPLNGITLCGKCHREFHHIYGHQCTIEDLADFIGLHSYLLKAAQLMIKGEQIKSNQKMHEALDYLKKYEQEIKLGGCE